MALGLTALVFLAIAVASLVAPHVMAQPLGLVLDNVNALSEFRAIYVGLWAVHAGLAGWAAWRPQRVLLGDIVGLLVAGQVVGRLLSVWVDGVPDASIWPPAIAEAIGAVVILGLRPEP